MREPIDMLRIAAGGISMSGNLYSEYSGTFSITSPAIGNHHSG